MSLLLSAIKYTVTQAGTIRGQSWLPESVRIIVHSAKAWGV